MARVGKNGSNYGRGIAGIWQRELGGLSPRNFAYRVGASEVPKLGFKFLKPRM